MSEETLKIVVPLFTAVLVAFVTFFFTRSHYERKRKDDLEDRAFNKRLEVKNLKVGGVQSYLNDSAVLVLKTGRYENAIIISEDIEQHRVDFQDIEKLLEATSRNVINISLLDDIELSNLRDKRLSLLDEEFQQISVTTTRIRKREPLDRVVLLQRASEFNVEAAGLIGKMHRRLDTISQTMP